MGNGIAAVFSHKKRRLRLDVDRLMAPECVLYTSPSFVCIVHTMNSADLIRLLKENGFTVISTRGSHHKMRNAANVTVIVPHPKKDLGKGLVSAILKQAGL
jgi:predicted RNA binding protein YcfA (HicA-like mRNA interferase family)